MNVAEILQKRSVDYAHKPALIFKDQTIDFQQLSETVFRLADSLRDLGVAKGDRVAIYLPSWPQYVYSYLAVWCLGAVAVPLDFMLTEDEIISCVAHAEAKALIIKPKATIALDDFRKRCPKLNHVISCHDKKEGALHFETLCAKGRNIKPSADAADTDYAIIFYTSGTTGKPKGVLINYRQLGAPPESMHFFVDLTEKDIVLCALPFSHLGGLIYIQNTIVFGLTMVLMERFIPTEFLKNVQQYKVSCFWIVPSMYYAFLQLKEFETFDLSSLRWMVTFGASNSPEALRRFRKYCPSAHLLNGWGLTETNAPTTVIPLGSDNIESVGRAAPWIEVKVFDDSGRPLPAGGVGEVAVKGWVVTDGYYKDPELTKATIRSGWFFSGDLGRIDTDGFLYIVGRKKEMIKVGGEIVVEPEVEAVLHKHPAVAEVAVIGVPDALRGEVPKAYIVVKQGESLSAEDLRFFCRQHLAHFKIPHHFEFIESLPKNRIGKVDKEALRKGLKC